MNPRPSAIPPAAITGKSTASTTWGRSAIVVNSPTCPPDSVPSAIIASTPRRAIRLASATEGTTGIILIPASLNIVIYGPGLPAPAVTTFTPSSTMTLAKSSQCGFISIKLTPKGLSVSSLHFLISLFKRSASQPPEPIIPSPPAFETAAASSAKEMFAIPPWIIGYFIFNKVVKDIFLSSFIIEV